MMTHKDETVSLSGMDVAVRLGGNVIICGIDFEAVGPKIVGLVGANGSGKTTLLNAISGFVNSTGEIRASVSGREKQVSALNPVERGCFGIGRTFQTPQLVPTLSVVETIALGALSRTQDTGFSLRGWWAADNYRRKIGLASEIASQVGLARFLEEPPRNLPLGHQRLLEVARVMAGDYRIILLDEPYAGLTREERRRLTDALAPLRDKGALLIIVEHNMSVIRAITDEVWLMEAGQIVDRGHPTDLFQRDRIRSSYLGDESPGYTPRELADDEPSRND